MKRIVENRMVKCVRVEWCGVRRVGRPCKARIKSVKESLEYVRLGKPRKSCTRGMHGRLCEGALCRKINETPQHNFVTKCIEHWPGVGPRG